ncbi:MAG: hypothetical protein KDB14_26525 [Planctomycetales bacterium]|nr:hypothetical protein [Planctomycetales bacterium]
MVLRCFMAAFTAVFLLFATATASAQEKWSLSPYVLTTIPSEPRNEETFTGPLTLPVNSASWTPYSVPTTETLAEMQKHVVLRRPIWNLEFSFKPLRMIKVDLPTAEGVESRLIWYMVYRIRYLGEDLQASPAETNFGGKTYPRIEKVAGGPHRFFPRFLLKEYQELNKEYMDRVIPAAIDPIFRREFKPNRTENPSGKLYDSVSISSVPIEASTPEQDKSVWGVVTWDNIDPRVDYFSIFIQGLSNAFEIEIDGQGKAGKMKFKTLKLNFSRPGDSLEENEREILYGLPITANPRKQPEMTQRYGQQKRVDHLWFYQ